MGKKKMKETEVVKFLKDEVEKVTGLKCKVVPQSDTWYDGFCLDTGNLSLHMFLEGNLEERQGRMDFIDWTNPTVIKFWIESEKRFISLNVSANGMRIIDKKGIDQVLSEIRKRGIKIWEKRLD